MVQLSRNQNSSSTLHTFAQDVIHGLSNFPKSLPSRYFYDKEGSRLFQQIMQLPEYYLTRAEFDVLTTHKKQMANAFAQDGYFHLIDLGAGDALKTTILLKELQQAKPAFDYVPVDISGDAMEQLAKKLRAELPNLGVNAVVGEYFESLRWLQTHKPERKVLLFLGSNIGNFEPDEAKKFLNSIHSFLNKGDRLLIGIDLQKDPAIIIPAYDDSAGVTAAFNLNLLTRINNELGGNFDLGKFKHYATYQPQLGAMRSYLISKEKQEVYLSSTGNTFLFESWEAIHTENSYKYTLGQFEAFAMECGFEQLATYQDKNKYFADVLFTVA